MPAYTLPPPLAALRERALSRRAAWERLRVLDAQEPSARLTEGRWYFTTHLATRLCMSREALYQALPRLTHRRGRRYNAPYEIHADERLFAFLDEHFIPYTLQPLQP